MILPAMATLPMTPAWRAMPLGSPHRSPSRPRLAHSPRSRCSADIAGDVESLRRHDLPNLPILVGANVNLPVRILAESARQHRPDFLFIDDLHHRVAGDLPVFILQRPDRPLGVIAV